MFGPRGDEAWQVGMTGDRLIPGDDWKRRDEELQRTVQDALDDLEVEGIEDDEGLYPTALDVLRELVALKDGPRDAGYELREPMAWKHARRVVERDKGC